MVATDISSRCLALADLTVRLNEVDVDLRLGDLFDPVADDRFDLVVSNPPFVISPGTGEQLVYRDSGLPGDEIVRQVVVGGAGLLADGGWCQVLANWAHHKDQPWTERIAGWIAEAGCDGWAVQRGLMDPPRYVEMWLNDAGLHGGPDYFAQYDAWLSWFEQEQIEAVGFGWLALHKSSTHNPVVRVEQWPYDVEQPMGPFIADWGREVAAAAAYDAEGSWLEQRLVRADDVLEERTGLPGAEDPQQIVVRQQRGMRRARQMTTVEAAFYGACDGELSVGQIADALVVLLETDPTEIRDEVAKAARDLLVTGFFTVAEPA